MLCQDCGKREATVHLTQVINDEKVELHLCRECAEKRRFHTPFEGVPFPLAEFLASMLDQSLIKKPSKVSDKKCSTCGMYFSDFSKTGRLGCGNCYATFRSQLNDLLRKIHGSTKHQGKVPHMPGDRMSECGGLMKPIGFAYKSGKGFQIVHKCLWCGCTSVNKVAKDTLQPDDIEALERLWKIFRNIRRS